MASMEVIIGVVVILGALVLGWAGRPSAAGFTRRAMSMPSVEPYFPIIVAGLLVTGAIFIALGLGLSLGPPS
jgi:hypothetical protein